MRTISSAWLPLALMAFLAAVTFWLQRASQPEDLPRQEQRHDPEFIVDNFTLRRFDIHGGLQYVLIAEKMLHYGDAAGTEIIGPSLTHYGGERPARIFAQRARVSRDGKELLLSGDVRMVREATKEQPSLVVTTEEMYVYPDEDIARGSRPVTITEGKSVIRGEGFVADNQARIVKLTGRVRGIIYRRLPGTP